MGGFSKSKSSSEQESFSGVPRAERERAARQGLDVLNTKVRPAINRFRELGPPILQLGKFGLQPKTEDLFNRIFRQENRTNFNNASASAAQRGQVTPDSLGSVLGSAAQRTGDRLATQFVPIAEDNQRFNVVSPVSFQTSLIDMLGQLAALFGQFTQGGEGKGASSSSSFGFSVQNPFGKTSGGTANSDRRLKSNIIKIGMHNRGMPLYQYTIFGETRIGVMADEVLQFLPEAVGIDDKGYYTVNYEMLNREVV